MQDSEPQNHDTGLAAGDSSHEGMKKPELQGLPHQPDQKHQTTRGSGSGNHQAVGLAAGDLLGPFQIEQSIGIGGMGSVFLAKDMLLERQVALKILPVDQNGLQEVVQRFLQEGRAAARLDHPNIARVYCLGQDQGIHYIAFEYIQGETIRNHLDKTGKLPISEVVQVGLQIAEALVHASARGVVHRDIKPSNILITPEGRIKLVDLGLARFFERNDDGHALTQTGVTLGTFDYISPEQARDPRDVDVRSDLYSLGCTLYHMLTGQPPFPEGTVLQKLIQHQEEPAPDVRSFRADAPAGLAHVVRTLLQKERSRRYQTPEQLRNELRKIESPSVSSTVPMPSTATQSRWGKHLIWGIPAIGLGCVILAFSWWGPANETTAWPQAKDDVLTLNPAETDKPRQGTGGFSNNTAEPPILTSTEQTHRETKTELLSELPRSISVGSDSDLSAIIGSAPHGSTITLTDNGPYLVAPTLIELPNEPTSPLILPRKLTIRADELVHPVIRIKPAVQPLRQHAAMLAFRGGKIDIQRIEFQFESERTDAALSALSVEGTELSLTGCLFRDRSGTKATTSYRALEIRNDNRSSDASVLPPAVRVVSCFFDANMIGVFGRGPTDVVLRDCLFGPGQPVAWFDNPFERGIQNTQIELQHCSIMAATSPLFRFNGCVTELTLEKSIIGPIVNDSAILVATDNPAQLHWQGRENLYGQLASYLMPLGNSTQTKPIVSYEDWINAPGEIREIRSQHTEEKIWSHTDPRPLLAQLDPSPAFSLARFVKNSGARQNQNPLFVQIGNTLAGIFGPDRKPNGLTVDAPDPPNSAAKPEINDKQPGALQPQSSVASAPGLSDMGPMEMQIEEVKRSPMVVASESDPMKPMAQGGTESIETLEEARPVQSFDPVVSSSRNLKNENYSGSNAAASPSSAEAVGTGGPLSLESEPRIREAVTGRELRTIVQSPSAGGGSRVLVGSLETLTSGPVKLAQRSRWSLEGRSSGRRSRLELEPDLSDERELTQVPAFFSIPSGASLELADVDIVLTQAHRPPDGRWTVFAVEPGGSLTVKGCTLTLEGQPEATQPLNINSSIVRLIPGNWSQDAPTSVRFEDCVVRAESDIVEDSIGRSAELSFVNSILSSGGRLLHGRSSAFTPATDDRITLKLRQDTARVLGGLVLLEAGTTRSKIPKVLVEASDTVLSTGGRDVPLLRVEGQTELQTLSDRITWEGQRVVYHEIQVYRLDESTRSGESTLGKTRASWEVAVSDHDDSPYHGNAGFLRSVEPGTEPWELSVLDLRLSPESSVPLAGPRLDQLPLPPSSHR